MDETLRETAYPFLVHLGMTMEDWSDGRARFRLPIAPHLMNRHGNPHGGAHAALLDTVMGYAGCWTGDPDRPQLCLTLSLTVQYLSRPRGTAFIGEGTKTGEGQSTCYAEGTVSDDTGDLIARVAGVFRYREA